MKDLVSVIVPVYNVEKYIEKCVRSILTQTYSQLEIILIDDGATDQSGERCDLLALEDSRIHVIHKTNGGLSSARNAGLDYATGEFICFVDSDDAIHSEMIATLKGFLDQESADIGMCKFVMVGEKGNVYQQSQELDPLKLVAIGKLEAQLALLENNDLRSQYIVVWNKLYRAALFSEIRFPEGKLHEDEATTFLLLYQAKKIVYYNKPLYYYLDRPGSIMAGGIGEKRFDLFDAYITRMHFYLENQEVELFRRTLIQAVHMLCQYIKWSEHTPGKNTALIEKYHGVLHEEYRSHKKSFTKAEKMELTLFGNWKLYYIIWKRMGSH